MWTFAYTKTVTYPYSPVLDNLRSQELFTGTLDEESFSLASARIELRDFKAVDLMRDIMNEMFVANDITVCRITGA